MLSPLRGCVAGGDEAVGVGGRSTRHGMGDTGRTPVSSGAATAESPPSCRHSPHAPVCERAHIPHVRECFLLYLRLVPLVKVGGVFPDVRTLLSKKSGSDWPSDIQTSKEPFSFLLRSGLSEGGSLRQRSTREGGLCSTPSGHTQNFACFPFGGQAQGQWY